MSYVCQMRSTDSNGIVSRIVRMLGSELCRSLPGLHTFTGCETVSAFSGKGKVTALKLVKQNQSFQTLFQENGME